MDAVKKASLVMLGVTVLGINLNISAANLPTLSPQADAALQRERLENQRRQEQIRQRAQQVQIPSLRGEALSTQVLTEDAQRFALASISITPSVFIPREVLSTLAQPYVGREIGFSDLNELLSAINRQYEELGQLTARALIPPQTLEQGVLRILLVEAKIDQVTWKGRQGQVNDSFYDKRLEVKAGEVLNSPELMARIQRFNSTTPGPQVSAGLAPGVNFGTTRLDLEVYEPKTLDWQVFANNYGNESTGRGQLGAYLSWFSPTGVADTLSATVVGSEGTEYLNMRYSRPVNRFNGIVYGEIGVNRLKINQGALKDLNIDGDSQVYTLGYTQPWWINEHWLLTGGGFYSREESKTTIEGVGLSKTDVDDFTLQAQVEWRDGPWYLRYDQRLRHAIANNAISGEHGEFQILNGYAYAMRRLGERFEGVARLSWQWTTDAERLPSTLSYQFGGIGSIRGYDAGVIAAPHGVIGNLEAYWRADEHWQPFIFYDYGKALKMGIHDQELHSTGLGLNFNWNPHFSVSAVLAHTLTNVVPDQDKNQFLVQLTLR